MRSTVPHSAPALMLALTIVLCPSSSFAQVENGGDVEILIHPHTSRPAELVVSEDEYTDNLLRSIGASLPHDEYEDLTKELRDSGSELRIRITRFASTPVTEVSKSSVALDIVLSTYDVDGRPLVKLPFSILSTNNNYKSTYDPMQAWIVDFRNRLPRAVRALIYAPGTCQALLNSPNG